MQSLQRMQIRFIRGGGALHIVYVYVSLVIQFTSFMLNEIIQCIKRRYAAINQILIVDCVTPA